MKKRFSRTEAAKYLGISRTQVRRLEEKKILNGVPDPNGHIFFSAHEVIALGIKRGVRVSTGNAQLQTVVYEMLARNETPYAIMKATGLTIEQLRELHALLLTPLDAPLPTVVPLRQSSPSLESDADHERRIRELDEELSAKRLAPWDEPAPNDRERQPHKPLARTLPNRFAADVPRIASLALRKGRLR